MTSIQSSAEGGNDDDDDDEDDNKDGSTYRFKRLKIGDGGSRYRLIEKTVVNVKY